jgi:hypothetical protein
MTDEQVNELLAAAKAVCENTYVGQHHRPVNERSRFGNYEAKYYHRLRRAISAMETNHD